MDGGHTSDWSRLGSARPSQLVEARLQLHWAAQALVAAADAVLENKPDDRHTNMRWDDRRRALVGHASDDGLRVALLVEELSLVVLDDDGDAVHSLSLPGQTLDTAMAWVAQAMGTDASLYPRSYDMPDHDVARGGRFDCERGEALDELARWYATADEALNELVGRADGAMPVATWPHHFDMGGIIRLDRQRPLDRAPQIGFGMSPGDRHIAEPYYYVTPWPIPDGAALPALPHGAVWRADGLKGAVLSAAQLIEIHGGDARASAVRDFVDFAIAEGRALIPPTA